MGEQKGQGSLIVCPTPLGNLGDITERTLEAFRRADVVCAEDTRVTGKLLTAYGLRKRLERLDENMMAERATSVVERVRAGEVIAYCSDAGMPGVSDPGLRLVAAARDAGVAVEVLPGPSAAATAYVASGCTNPRFYFGGFFPRKEAARAEVLRGLAALDAALIFYESPNRLVGALRTLAETFPARRMSVCRELTKLHEEVVRGTTSEVCAAFEKRAHEPGGIRGEVVLVVDGVSEQERAATQRKRAQSADERAYELAAGGMRKKDIVRALVSEFALPRNDAYECALAAGKRAAAEAAAGAGAPAEPGAQGRA